MHRLIMGCHIKHVAVEVALGLLKFLCLVLQERQLFLWSHFAHDLHEILLSLLNVIIIDHNRLTLGLLLRNLPLIFMYFRPIKLI